MVGSQDAMTQPRIAALTNNAGTAVAPLYQCVAGRRNTSHSNVFARSGRCRSACKTSTERL